MKQFDGIDGLLQKALHSLLPELQKEIPEEVLRELYKEFGKDPNGWKVEKLRASLKKHLDNYDK